MTSQSIRVLIVDDNPQVCQGLATMLELATKKQVPRIVVVGEAHDGKDALEKAQFLHPEVILMDLEMPVMDGFLSTKSIKAWNPTIFIIILTIHEDLLTRQKATQAGADAFFGKSTPAEGLIRAIQDFWTAD